MHRTPVRLPSHPPDPRQPFGGGFERGGYFRGPGCWRIDEGFIACGHFFQFDGLCLSCRHGHKPCEPGQGGFTGKPRPVFQGGLLFEFREACGCDIRLVFPAGRDPPGHDTGGRDKRPQDRQGGERRLQAAPRPRGLRRRISRRQPEPWPAVGIPFEFKRCGEFRGDKRSGIETDPVASLFIPGLDPGVGIGIAQGQRRMLAAAAA